MTILFIFIVVNFANFELFLVHLFCAASVLVLNNYISRNVLIE